DRERLGVEVEADPGALLELREVVLEVLEERALERGTVERRAGVARARLADDRRRGDGVRAERRSTCKAGEKRPAAKSGTAGSGHGVPPVGCGCDLRCIRRASPPRSIWCVRFPGLRSRAAFRQIGLTKIMMASPLRERQG